MDAIQVAITAVATLTSVLLGGWVTIRAQDRLWRRDQSRQWRDIRLMRYGEFLSAFRDYVAYIQLPDAQITTVRRPREPHDLMPYFDQHGLRYKENLEATKTALRLVSGSPQLVESSRLMVRNARLLAADRASLGVEAMPAARFDECWAAERAFVRRARDELGLDSEFNTDSDSAGPPSTS